MRSVFFLLILLNSLPAQLAFESEHIIADFQLSQSTYEAVFPFTVEEDTSISRIKTTCSCIGGTIYPDKKEWKKGEKGSVKSTLDLSQIKGKQTKNLAVLYADGNSQTLSVTIDIPKALTSSPKSHKWTVGERALTKTFEITILPGFDFEITDVLVSNKLFDFELTPQDAALGKTYQLSVTPKETSARQICSFRLKTNAKAKQYQILTVLALISD